MSRPRPHRVRAPRRLGLDEAAFQQQVLDLAHLLGYQVAHFRPAQRADGSWRTAVTADGAGFPDLVLAGRHKVIFAELKSDRGSVRAEQIAWLEQLRAAGHPHVYLWRPADLPQIQQLLQSPLAQPAIAWAQRPLTLEPPAAADAAADADA